MKYALLLMLYLCLALVYFMLRNETKAKKNIILGVTLPYAARQDEAVRAVCRSFLKQLNIVTLALALLPLPILAVPHASVAVTCYLTWIIPAVFVPYIPYVRCHKRLRAYKRETAPAGAAATLVDLKLAAMPKKSISLWWFLPPLLMAAFPIVYSLLAAPRDKAFPGMLVGYGANFLVTLLFAGLYRLIDRQRGDVVEDNATLNAALTQVRRYQWGRTWVAFAWLTGVFCLCLWLLESSPWGLILTALAYTAIIIAVCIRTEFAARRAQESLTAESGQGYYADDDRHWIWGMIYFNPNDKHLAINNRVGIGMSINLAHWAGKLFMGLSIAALLLLPLAGVWMMRLEFTPITLTVSDAALVVRHTDEVCRLARDEIISAKLLDSLPPAAKRVGTNLDVFYEGAFYVEGYGVAELCLNPEAPPFLLVETEAGIWLFSAGSPEETRAAYEALSGS